MRQLVAAASMLALVGAGVATGCADEETFPIEATGGEAVGGSGGSGAGASGGSGGQGGEPVEPGRGDPSEFPTECLESCAEACAQLATCGGETSAVFPIDEAECLERCEMAEGGDYWDDISATFKCCTSQADCADVEHCGGWLMHPGVIDACTWYCECRMAGAVASRTAGHRAPAGYRFAPDALMVDPGPATVELSRVSGVRAVRAGKLTLVRLEASADQATLAELDMLGRVLPTFVDAGGRISAASGDLVLVVEQPAALSKALSFARGYGLSRHRPLKTRLASAPSAELHLLAGTDPWRTLDAAQALSKLPGVQAEIDHVRYYEKRYAPNDPLFDDQWHLANTGQSGSTVSVDGRVAEAWDVTMGDAQVLIAINDDGIDLNHPEFVGKLDPAINFPADWETQITQGTFGGHGTSVAGVAAALADNDEGGSGVCPNCRLVGHLVGESSGWGFQVTDADIAQGFTDIVDAGAWVINNSWGYETGDPVYALTPVSLPPLAAVVQASFDYAETSGRGGLGTVILFAAGNSNDVLDPYTAYTTNVSVAALDDLGLKPYYSSFGPDNDVTAPSNGGLNGITTTAILSQYTADFGGTSSASPFAAGVVGLIFSADPSLTAAEARDLLTSTATKIDLVFGRWDQNGHSDFHGAGLVNAYAAVQLAIGGCATPDQCVAPSDDCGAACGTLTGCAVCRTHADCAADHVCQALPSLGQLVCVAAKGAGSCAAGTTEVNEYCLPSPTTCGTCVAAEACNGRDDDCDDQVDEDDVCQGGPMCFVDGPGCGAAQVCAGRRCAAECDEDADCGTNQTCERLKTQYGDVPGHQGCMEVNSHGGRCQRRCEVRASSLPDDELAAFVDCTVDGTADCSEVDICRELLP